MTIVPSQNPPLHRRAVNHSPQADRSAPTSQDRHGVASIGHLTARLTRHLLPHNVSRLVALKARWHDAAGSFASWVKPVRFLTNGAETRLEVACAPARVLELQHESGKLLDQLNLLWGQQAFSGLKITGDVRLQSQTFTPPPRARTLPASLSATLAKVTDPALQAHLTSLTQAVLGKDNSRLQVGSSAPTMAGQDNQHDKKS